MENQIKHLIISRVALKWRYHETKLSWKEWLNESILLFNNFCKKSLINQTNQNFTLISLVDESVNLSETLNNEIVLKCKNDIVKTINSYIATLNYKKFIITRIDRDDCLKNDFVEIIQNHFSNNKTINTYADIYDLIIYDIFSKETFISDFYNINTSPFISTFEEKKLNNIECLPYSYQHNKNDYEYLLSKINKISIYENEKIAFITKK